MERSHLVLVPGFGGFDALGGMDYYPRTAELLDDWRLRKKELHVLPVLHKFKNYPTASVDCRAKLLLVYLAEKMENNEILAGERVTLLGHSTGGLDIRHLLFLCRRRAEETVQPRSRIKCQDVRRVIHRVIYMSVPQFGTNIADFALTIRRGIQDAAGDIVRALSKGIPLADLLVDWSRRSPCHIVKAVGDVVAETNVPQQDGPEESGDREISFVDSLRARSDVIEWLSLIEVDVQALRDLRAFYGPAALWVEGNEAEGHEAPRSPAHYNDTELQLELDDYSGDLHTRGATDQNPKITTLTFATYDSRRNDGCRTHPPRKDAWHRAERANSCFWHSYIPLGRWLHKLEASRAFSRLDRIGSFVFGWYSRLPAPLRFFPRIQLLAYGAPLAAKALGDEPGLLYDSCHEITSNPHDQPPCAHFVAEQRVAAGGKAAAWGDELAARHIDMKTNDGIVNTLSMLWPSQDPKCQQHQVEFVSGDHGDIIGHYCLHHYGHYGAAGPPLPAPSGRRFIQYDILESGLEYDEGRAREIWYRVFEFAFTIPAQH